jgi:hypothetical protein
VSPRNKIIGFGQNSSRQNIVVWADCRELCVGSSALVFGLLMCLSMLLADRRTPSTVVRGQSVCRFVALGIREKE